MDQTSQERLTALAEAYKQQKSKLSKVQSDEAASLLSQILISSVGPAYDTVEGFIRGLPADTTAKAVGDSWTQLPEATRKYLLNSLPDLPRGDRFDRLKLLAGAAIVDVDPANGLTFLCTACTSLAPRSGNHFALELVQLFRKAFLEGQEPRIHKLNITAHPSVVTAALLNLLISSLLNTSQHIPPLAPIFQLPAVKWLFSSQAYSKHLKATQQTQLVETIKKWDTTLQDEVKKAMSLLPSGLPELQFLLAPPRPIKPEPAAQPSGPPVAATSQPEKQTLHWKDLLAALHKQLTKLDQDLTTANEQADGNRAENQKLKESLENAELDTRNLRKELAKKTGEYDRATQALSAAQSAAAQATQRAEALESEIATLKRQHADQIAILESRVETEAAHRLESFQHSLARALRVDYAHFKICEGKPMNIELGQGLQALLSAIFDRLQRQGINAKD